MNLHPTAIQEALSLAYCHAVIASAGFSHSKGSSDNGIDLYINSVGLFDGKRVDMGVVLAIQLKSTINARIENDKVKYKLDIEAYRRLKIFCAQIKILVVYVMPRDSSLWVLNSTENLIMRDCAYWLRVSDLPSEVANASSITIEIPSINIFSPEAILGLTKSTLDMFDGVNFD